MSQVGAMLYEDITKTIIGRSFELINELGSGFLESVYEKSLYLLLTQSGLEVKCQHPIAVHFRGVCVGEFYADLLVEDKVIIELKSVRAISSEHQAQVIHYLMATGLEVGLLINFGRPKLEYKRLTRNQLFSLGANDEIDEAF